MKTSALFFTLTLTLTLTAACAYDDSHDAFAQETPIAESDNAENPKETQGVLFAPRYLELLNLANCYATGIDAIGLSDLDQGRAILSNCLTADVDVTVEFPGVGSFAFENLNDFTNFVDQFFSGEGYVRTQHHASNIVRGTFGRTMRSYISATHVRPDNSVDLNTVIYDDEIDWVNGRWLITRRDILITSDARLLPAN